VKYKTPIGIVATAALVPLLSLVAWAEGGGKDKLPDPPRPAMSGSAAAPLAAAGAAKADGGASPSSGAPAKTQGAAPSGAVYVQAMRLVEKMQDARVDAKALPAARSVLGGHWRKMRAPWFPIPATDAGRLVTSIALRTSDTETQWAAPTGGGNAWKPEARVWNMNEGSYDQREAIAAPTPSTISFHLELPQGALFSFTPGSVNATGEAVTMSVFVTDARGTRTKVGGARLPAELTRKWGEEARVDLSAYAGQTVDLELLTEAVPKGESEAAPVHHAPPRRQRGDAGPEPTPEETPVTPGATLVGLYGNPVILKKEAAKVPYNVLFIVVDALRPDVLASFHEQADDEMKAHARRPPLEAQLPKVPGLMPVMDELAKKSVIFTHAYSGGAWTRPGTLAMLSGARSSELGLATLPWVLPEAEVSRFYGSHPPLLPVLMRAEGVTTRAFVNNYFMVGYAPVGVDMGFERVDDHRYRARDTEEITKDAVSWLKQNADTRFFSFVNYNSPHEPWEPPQRMQKRVPAAPDGPEDRISRLYMAEAGKDDEAIGTLLQTLDELKIADHTIIVITADHGETLSAAHTGTGLDKMQVRYHHAASNYEETTKVPILIRAPGLLPEGVRVQDRIRNTDIAPTLLDLLGVDGGASAARMSGRTLVPLIKGQKDADPRMVISEGRGSRGIIWDHYRLILRDNQNVAAGEKAEELFDLTEDPGERNNIAQRSHDVVQELRARFDAAQKNVPVAGSREAKGEAPKAPADDTGAVHLRFAGGGAPHRISGKITSTGRLTGTAVGAEPGSLRSQEHELELAFTTLQDTAVGVDLSVTPPHAPLSWQLYVDDVALVDTRVFAGPYGLVAKDMVLGISTEDARARAQAEDMPLIDPRRDFGLFVTREKRGSGNLSGRDELTGEGADEMNRLLREWGYAK
jgi:arylsulfatase A-like enzyme